MDLFKRQSHDEWKYKTLEDYVFKLLDENKVHSEEFKRLVRLFGRDKIKAIYLKYKANRQVK